eukprot:scaffold2187_cov109-Isochrysis_galbana.AAC.1
MTDTNNRTQKIVQVQNGDAASPQVRNPVIRLCSGRQGVALETPLKPKRMSHRACGSPSVAHLHWQQFHSRIPATRPDSTSSSRPPPPESAPVASSRLRRRRSASLAARRAMFSDRSAALAAARLSCLPLSAEASRMARARGSSSAWSSCSPPRVT